MWRSTSMDSTATGRPRVCILWRGGVSCPVSAAWHFCVAAHWSKYHCYKQAPSWYDLRCFKLSDVKPKQTNKLILLHLATNNPWFADFITLDMTCVAAPPIQLVLWEPQCIRNQMERFGGTCWSAYKECATCININSYIKKIIGMLIYSKFWK